MRSVFVVAALAALTSAQRLTRPNTNPINNVVNVVNDALKNLPKITLTATETVYVSSCAPVTNVCTKTGKGGAVTTTTSVKAATTTTKAAAATTTTTKAAATTTTPPPAATPSCFRIQARSPNQSINNAYFDSAFIPETLVSFTKNAYLAGIYTIDSSSQLRNARNGAIASRALLGRSSYGPVWIAAAGRRRTDDKVTCTNEKGSLKCSAAGGSKLYSMANNLYIAKDANVPRTFQSVELVATAEKCPVGMAKF